MFLWRNMENCHKIPTLSVPLHRSILLQKAQIHPCSFRKNCILISKFEFIGKASSKTWQVAINTWQPFTHDWICHLSSTGLNVYHLQPTKMKEISLFKCMEACFLFLIYSANVFLSHSSTLTNAKTIWECRLKDGNSSLVTYTYFLYLYTIPIPIRSRQTKTTYNQPIKIKYWYRKVEKHERWWRLNIEQIACKKSIYAISVWLRLKLAPIVS